MKKNAQRAVVEMSFIIFLFYANLLMGQFISSGMGEEKGLVWAILNIFTLSNFIIAVVAAFIGYIVFEYLRKKL